MSSLDRSVQNCPDDTTRQAYDHLKEKLTSYPRRDFGILSNDNDSFLAGLLVADSALRDGNTYTVRNSGYRVYSRKIFEFHGTNDSPYWRSAVGEATNWLVEVANSENRKPYFLSALGFEERRDYNLYRAAKIRPFLIPYFAAGCPDQRLAIQYHNSGTDPQLVAAIHSNTPNV